MQQNRRDPYCNIYQSISVVKELNDRYITIGPDVWRENKEHPEFEEDCNFFPSGVKVLPRKASG